MNKKPVIIDLNIDLNVPTVSSQLNLSIIGSYMEFLLFHRNHLPFNFASFDLLVKQKRKIHDDSNNWSAFKVQRQLELAQETIDSINLVKEVSTEI